MVPAFGVGYPYADGTAESGEEVTVIDLKGTTSLCTGKAIDFGDIQFEE